jgi:hypothetical protein
MLKLWAGPLEGQRSTDTGEGNSMMQAGIDLGKRRGDMAALGHPEARQRTGVD